MFKEVVVEDAALLLALENWVDGGVVANGNLVVVVAPVDNSLLF